MSHDLFLDDVRDPDWIHPSWHVEAINFTVEGSPMIRAMRGMKWDYPDRPPTVVRSFAEFVKHIELRYEADGAAGMPSNVAFDHDLEQAHYQHNYTGDNEGNGADCARWLVQFCLDRDLTFPRASTHSMNPAGRKAILMAFVDGYRQRYVYSGLLP